MDERPGRAVLVITVGALGQDVSVDGVSDRPVRASGLMLLDHQGARHLLLDFHEPVCSILAGVGPDSGQAAP